MGGLLLSFPRRWLLAGALLVALGCPGPTGSGGTFTVPTPEAWTAADTDRVQKACGRCHAAPPPDVLPRQRWAEIIPTMPAMPGPEGVAPASPEETALAGAYFQRNAPEAFEAVPPAPLEARLRFRTEGFTPQHPAFAARIPGVANVQFVHLSDPRRLDLLVADMRASGLFLLAPWAPPRQRTLRHLAKELGSPAHVVLQDVDGDGRQDLLVASLGAVNPSNETRGRVTLLRQDAKRRFRPQLLLGGIGRTCDARAADFDGDGDRDVIVAVFGWRGPGSLTLLERQGGDPPSFTPHVLDDRDGFIHTEPVDLNGDGRLDLVTLLSQEHEQVIAYLNRGGLRFEPVVLDRAPHPAWGSSGLQTVDLDGDGDLDVLVSNGDTLDDDLLKPYHGVRWLENQGELRFVPHTIGPLYGAERAIATDLDGDGDLDVVAVAFLPQLDPAVWRERDLDSVVWFEQTGEGWRRAALEKQRCYHPTVDAGDYDGDGDVDLAVGNAVWVVRDGEASVQADMVTLFTAEPRDGD